MFVGCDPEFYVRGGQGVLNVRERLVREGFVDSYSGTVGWDHNGWVGEIRPNPAETTPELIQNIQNAIRNSRKASALRGEGISWRAGAFWHVGAGESRTIGGHVHLDNVDENRTGEIEQRLVQFYQWFLHFGWFPEEECRLRERSYDIENVRTVSASEAGVRMEFRRFPSWLYSKALATVVLGFSKAAVLQPRRWDRYLIGAATRPKLLRFATEAWGGNGAATGILTRGELDRVDVERDVWEEWRT